MVVAVAENQAVLEKPLDPFESGVLCRQDQFFAVKGLVGLLQFAAPLGGDEHGEEVGIDTLELGILELHESLPLGLGDFPYILDDRLLGLLAIEDEDLVDELEDKGVLVLRRDHAFH
jgi:hypothetical protein